MPTTRVRVLLTSLALSAAGFVGIAGYEGYTDRAVIPIPGDVPTIGFGTTGGVKLGDKTTPPVALRRALQDITKFEGAVKQCVTVPLHQWEYDAYLSLAYNIGSGAFCSSTLVHRLNQGRYEEACRQILRWNRAGGRVVRGLVNRREAEYLTCVGEE